MKIPSPVTIHVISGSKQMDSMMHAFDVFESSKRLAARKTYKLAFKGEMDLSDRQKAVQAFKLAAEQTGDQIVAVWIEGDPETAFIDSTVQAISDGNKWQLLHPVLEAFGAK
jgi:hypothetical protein